MYGKDAGTSDLQARVGESGDCVGSADSGGGAGRRKGFANGVDGGGLAIGVGAERGGLRQEKGAFAVARSPDACAAVRLGAGIESGEQAEQFAGRILRQESLDQQAGGRGENIDTLGNRRAQAVNREAFGCDRRAEQVAMAEQILAIGVEAVLVAVAQRCQLRPVGQACAQFARQRCALLRIAATDGEHEQPGDRAFAELVDQHLLLGARVRGQKE